MKKKQKTNKNPAVRRKAEWGKNSQTHLRARDNAFQGEIFEVLNLCSTSGRGLRGNLITAYK